MNTDIGTRMNHQSRFGTPNHSARRSSVGMMMSIAINVNAALNQVHITTRSITSLSSVGIRMAWLYRNVPNTDATVTNPVNRARMPNSTGLNSRARSGAAAIGM